MGDSGADIVDERLSVRPEAQESREAVGITERRLTADLSGDAFCDDLPHCHLAMIFGVDLGFQGEILCGDAKAAAAGLHVHLDAGFAGDPANSVGVRQNDRRCVERVVFTLMDNGRQRCNGQAFTDHGLADEDQSAGCPDARIDISS